MLVNHSVHYKGKSGHQNCIYWRKLVLTREFNNLMDKWFLYVSCTHNFEHNILAKMCGLFTSLYGNPKNSTVVASAKVTVIQIKTQTISNLKLCNLFFLLAGVQ